MSAYSTKCWRVGAASMALALLGACAGSPDDGASSKPAPAAERGASAASPAALGRTVAAWQLDNLKAFPYITSHFEQTADPRGWIQATFWIGLDRFAEATNDEQLLRVVDERARLNEYALAKYVWHGDDQAIADIYIRAAERSGDLSILDTTREGLDGILADPPTVTLAFDQPAPEGARSGCQVRWCWADAMFMAPPVWSELTRVTGDERYRNYAMGEVEAMTDYLYDPQERLFYRDDRYFDQKTENGGGVFWSRGNGWVVAGLARLIESLPADDPRRVDTIALFTEMMDGLVDRQRTDGYWPTSLDDPALFTTPETSGTGFFGYALAWGLNNGVLSGDRYERSLDKAWAAMAAAVQPDGRLGWVQQVGKDPQATNAASTQVYGSGAFLLMAAEMAEREDG